jgi:hypothetical protein
VEEARTRGHAMLDCSNKPVGPNGSLRSEGDQIAAAAAK